MYQRYLPKRDFSLFCCYLLLKCCYLLLKCCHEKNFTKYLHKTVSAFQRTLFRQKISWVNNQYKLISVDNGESFELYNLINDRAEKENIAQKEPEIVTKMKKDLFEWINSVENSKKGLDYN